MARVRGGDERELPQRQLTEEAMANAALGIGLTHGDECIIEGTDAGLERSAVMRSSGTRGANTYSPSMA